MSGDVTVFAETNFRNQRRKFGIRRDDRRRHMYVVGKTGMGKSTLLENMIIDDIRAGNGLAVVDPHGDLAEKILEYIPNNRVNDVIYFNPADTQFPIAFNILESIGEDYKHLVAYGLVGVFKKIWADSWGPRMEYIMTNTILALLEYPGSTLLGLMRMLVDKAYRKKVVAKVQDPVVKTFWADEYANYSEKFRTEAIAPIQNKVGQFLASAIIRNIVGQSKSTIEMREIMDKQKILIMNLSKGRIGEENSALLGAMMITKLQIAAMSRVDIPESERKDFYLYVDEFQNFATDSFAGILSEARKYRLCLIMAHQYFEQLGDVVKAAVFGNVGTMIVFRVGAADAAELELEFAPQFLPADIVNLKKYTFCLRLMVDGVATEPFSGIGLPPADGKTSNKEKLIKVSRERYARPQALVEDRIIRWSGVEINRPGTPAAAGADGEEAVDNDDQGDDMNWPDPVWKSDEANEESATVTEDISITATGGIKVEAAQANTPSAFVNAAGFIPGDEAPATTAATPILVKPVLPTVRLAPDPEVNRPAMHVTQTAQSQPLAPTMAAPAADGPRPRISFINHAPVATEPEPEPQLQPQPVKTPVVTQAAPVKSAAVAAPAVQTQPTVVAAVQRVAVATAPTEAVSMPVKPQPTVRLEQEQPKLEPTPTEAVEDEDEEDDNGGDDDTDQSSGSISLQALKQGNVQSVKFTPNQLNGQRNPVSQSNTPGGNATNGQSIGDQPAKRKRKRKRKRSGAAAPMNGATGQTNNSTQPGPQTSAAQPTSMSAPKPVMTTPAQPTAPKPAAAQPAPQPKSSGTGDPTKVQWGDLL